MTVGGYKAQSNIYEKLEQFYLSHESLFLFFMANILFANCVSFSAFAKNVPVLSLCS